MAAGGMMGPVWALLSYGARSTLACTQLQASTSILARSVARLNSPLLGPVGCARAYSALPPHTVLGMPALSPTMTQGNVAKWHVKVGDEVKAGTVLADIETDKATLAFENQDEGFVAKILVEDGAKDLAIGTPVMIIVEEQEALPAFEGYVAGGAAAAPAPAAAAAAPAAASGAAAAPGKSYPPYTKLGMPSLSPTMERGNVAVWHVAEGASIKPGDLLADIETDKATLGFENQEDGFIAKILYPAGSKDVAVGVPLALLVEEASMVPAFADFTLEALTGAVAAPAPAAAAPATAAPAPAAPAAPAAAPVAPKVTANHRMGPAARILLEQSGLSAADVTPSGPNNIVTKGDVLAAIAAGVKPGAGAHAAPAAAAPPPPPPSPAAAAAAPAAPKPAAAAPAKPAAPAASKPAAAAPPGPGATYVDTPNSQIRRIIASRLAESKRIAPGIYASADAPLDALAEFRTTLAASGLKVSVNDVVLKAVAKALKDVPLANSFWDEKAGGPVALTSVDVSVAVATPTGLITPIVRDAAGKSLKQISADVKGLVAKARDNKLKPEEFNGGSFTVSNLGMYGLTNFSAIINPPQSAILAVGGPQQRVVLGADGQPKAESFMTVTLTADQRVWDGELLGAFLEAFCSNIAKPAALLV